MAEPEPSGERRKVEVLLRVSRSLGLSIELDPLLRLIVSEVTAAMEAERTSLFLVDPADPQSLVGRVAEGLVAEEVRIRFGVGIAGTTAETRQTINIPDAYRDDRFNPLLDRSSNFVTRSVLSNPIIGQKGRLVGVVQVLKRRGEGRSTKRTRRSWMRFAYISPSRWSGRNWSSPTWNRRS